YKVNMSTVYYVDILTLYPIKNNKTPKITNTFCGCSPKMPL
ncbi:MAG: hypothetical protein ACI9VL_000856, partial [Colwellia sp.]